MTKREFDLLLLLSGAGAGLSQRQLAKRLNCSLGTVNTLLKTFTSKKYFEGKKVTAKGYEALEPYRVKRAIFFAAGFGARLAPITLNTPKALIRVNGSRIIDSALDAVVAAGIPEIIIVRGYLGEQFDQLLYKYPQIKFVDNPLFNESNNISSAMCVRSLFENAYIMDADLIVNNPELIRTYEYQSNMVAVPVDRTDDWCMTVGRDGYIDSLSIGGIDAYREVGISYFTGADGSRLGGDIKAVYESPGGKERFWEQTVLIYKKKDYNIAVRQCSAEDVIEIDTFSELKRIDRSYDLK